MRVKTVFLSSTGKTLLKHRDVAAAAINGLDGYKCLRMEDFGSSSRDPDSFCRRKVAECDLFVGVLGPLYGSCPHGSELSFTEREYEAAGAAGIDRLMFMTPEDFPVPANLIEPDSKRAAQEAFRQRVSDVYQRSTFSSPAELATEIVKAIRNWEYESTVVTMAFKGRVRDVSIALASRTSSEADIRTFYQGKEPLSWGIVSANALIERDWEKQLLQLLRTPTERVRMVCIVGAPGAGKSSLAWQIAAKLSRDSNKLILQILDNTDMDLWYALPSFSEHVPESLYLLVDDIFRDENTVGALQTLDSCSPLTILATSRTNECPPVHIFPFEVVRWNLRGPSTSEKTCILKKLGKDRSHLRLVEKRRLAAANDFLVMMMEASAGEALKSILSDAVQRLAAQDDVVYRAYEYVTFAHQYSLSMPTSLLERLDTKGRFHRLLSRRAVEGLIIPNDALEGTVQSAHPLIAEHVFRLYSRDPCAVLGEIVDALDTHDFAERHFLALLVLQMAKSPEAQHLSETLVSKGKKLRVILTESSVGDLDVLRRAYEFLDQVGEAEYCGTLALTAIPRNFRQARQQARLLSRVSSEKALLYLNQALAKVPEDPWPRVTYLELAQRHFPEITGGAITGVVPWLEKHPDDLVVRSAYIAAVECHGTKRQITEVINQTTSWLKDHPEDVGVRRHYLGFVERRGTKKQITEVINQTTSWLKDHPEDVEVRRRYLGLVDCRGTKEQITEVINQTTSWLKDHPEDVEVRRRYLGLVDCRGTKEQITEVINLTAAWLQDHPEDVEVRRRYLGFVERRGTKKQITEVIMQIPGLLSESMEFPVSWRQLLSFAKRNGTKKLIRWVIDEIASWLWDRLEAQEVIRQYLAFVEQHGTKKQITELLSQTASWFEDHPEDVEVRRQYLGVVDRRGTKKQITELLSQTASWFEDHPEDVEVRRQYLGVVDRRGTKKQITELLSQTASWLQDHPEDVKVRRQYLGVVDRRGTKEQITEVINLTAAWLQDHPEDVPARQQNLGLVEQHGTKRQITELLSQTAAWLQDHPEDVEVRRHYLGLVERRGTKKQITEVINLTAAWLQDHPEDVEVRRQYLGVVDRRGTKNQISRAIQEVWDWLTIYKNPLVYFTYLRLINQYGKKQDTDRAIRFTAPYLRKHPESGGWRIAFLDLIKRKGSKIDKMQAIRETAKWLAEHPHDASVRVVYLSLVKCSGTEAQAKRSIRDTAAWLDDHPEAREVQQAYQQLVEREMSGSSLGKRRQSRRCVAGKSPVQGRVSDPP